MRVSLKWLKELFPAEVLESMPLRSLTSRLDLTGTVVESVEETGALLPGVVVGHIVSKEHHPEADKLWVCQVDVGEEEPVQIVCGAQNFEAGDKVPVAKVGAHLPGDVVIKKAKLRGQVSFGMNCSARELGVGTGAEGLMILPPDAPVGIDFATWYGQSDTILDLEITPNRPDCLSMVGVAREMGAVFDCDPLPLPEKTLTEQGAPISERATVTIEDPAVCPRYAARVIENVKIGPSPAWLAERVEAAGARSVNNVVDVTNYILFELGQPLHAFDYDRFEKSADGRAHIHVRRGTQDEKLQTLDGIERTLSERNLVIADEDAGRCLAGVMGGFDSEVTDDTTTIFLESAVFDPETTSRTSRKLGLISESSLRFERGVDITGVIRALDRAATLMQEVAGGSVAPGCIDEYPGAKSPAEVVLRQSRLQALTGAPITLGEAASLLERLGFTITARTQEALTLTVPGFRSDVAREVDVIEEVLRLWGMENVTATLPDTSRRSGMLTQDQRLTRKLTQSLRAAGLNEAMTYPFVNPAAVEKTGWSETPEAELVRLHNPMSQEQSVLRPLLITGLLEVVASNLNHGVENVQIYERGKTFTTTEGRKLPVESDHIAAVLTGAWNEPGWNEPAVALDFFDAKGIIEQLARFLGIDRLRFVEGEQPWLQPGRSATVLLGKKPIGWLGEIHPAVAASFEIDRPVAAFELALEPLLQAARFERDFAVPPRFPAIELDIALVVDRDVHALDLKQRIASLGRKAHLVDVRLFDVYEGKGVPEGKKSLAYRLSYRSDEGTLKAEDVEKAHAKLLERLATETGATQR